MGAYPLSYEMSDDPSPRLLHHRWPRISTFIKSTGDATGSCAVSTVCTLRNNIIVS